MLFLKYLFVHSKGKDWYDGFLWLLWHLICSLMPIWIVLLFLCLLKQPIEMGSFTKNAEFALYSASFLGTCLYIVLRDFRKNNFPSRAVLSVILFPTLVFCAIIYSLLAILNVLNEADISEPLKMIDKDLLVKMSWILLPTVFVLAFLVIVVDNIHSSMDPRTLQKESFDKLDQDFDRISQEDK